jgi:hypothetical protein
VFLLLTSYLFYQRERPVLAGVAVSAAASMRYVFAVFAVAGVATYLWKRKKPELQRYIVGGVLGALPFFVYSAAAFGSPFARITLYVERVAAWSGAGTSPAAVQHLLFFAAICGVFLPALAKTWRKHRFVTANTAVYAVFIVSVAGLAFARYWLPLTPFLLLAGWKAYSRRGFVVAAALFLAVTGVVTTTAHTAQWQCGAVFEDAARFAAELEEPVVATDQWAVAGYIIDEPVSSPWTGLDTLHQEHTVQYGIGQNPDRYRVLDTFTAPNCPPYHVFTLAE